MRAFRGPSEAGNNCAKRLTSLPVTVHTHMVAPTITGKTLA